MIEIRKTAIAFEEEELLELEQIIVDRESQRVRTEHGQLNRFLRP
jgi:hypothetical protein